MSATILQAQVSDFGAALITASWQCLFADGNGVSFGVNGNTITAGFSTVVFANANNVSFGLNGSTLTASASYSQSTGVAGISAGAASVGAGTVVFSNAGNVSFGLAGSTITATVTVPAQVPFGLSAGTQSVSTGTAVFSNSNGISFGMSGSSRITASFDAIRSISGGTTRATNGEIVFSNANNVSFGVNGNTITATVTVPAQVAFGISAGTQSVSTGTLIFSNANGVSFGMNNGTITATVTPGAAAGIAAITAGTQNATSGTVGWADANGISFGMNNGTITAKMPSVSYFEAINQKAFAANVAATNSAAINLSLQRVRVPFQISATRVDLLAHVTVAASTNGSYTLSAGIYTMAGSTASLVSSGSVGITFTSGTNQTAGTAYGGYSGTRWRSIPIGTWNVTPGEYMIGLMGSFQGPAGITGSWTWYGGSAVSLNADVAAGGAFTPYFADGIYRVATGAFPSSVHVTDINQTGAAVLRQPYFRLAGTF